MTLRIAFCGPNPMLNDNLVRHVNDLLSNDVVEAQQLPNVFQETMERLHIDNLQEIDLDWVNLWISVQRRMDEHKYRDTDLVLSATCGLDQLIIQATYLQDQVERASSGLVIADATGQESSLDASLVNRTGSILQVLLNQTEEEVVEYWDFVYAVVPAALGVSLTPDALLVQYEDFLTTVPAFASVEKLPDNEDAAKDALDQEVTKWKEILKPPSSQ
jgi:hypothetical protein